jgi:hypothetical protein
MPRAKPRYEENVVDILVDNVERLFRGETRWRDGPPPS